MHRFAEVETELSRFRLPVSRRMVALRQPRGTEDLIMLESARTPSGDASLALALADRLSRPAEGDALNWVCMAVADLDTLVMRLRQAVLGDRVWTDIACAMPGCGKRIDIEFGIDQFLAHHFSDAGAAPSSEGLCEPGAEPGWYRLTVDSEIGQVSYRLPTVADQLALAGSFDPMNELAERCIRPSGLPVSALERVEAAMEAWAPSLASDLQGSCPECGAQVTMYFDARWFCLRELRDRAAHIYRDVDVLARRYHWSESEIMAMPRTRRSAYVELARQEQGA